MSAAPQTAPTGPAPAADLDAERLHRKQRLAGAYRLFSRFGFDKGRAGHITARDPILTDHFWVNPWGRHFSKMRVSDLLLVNSRGDVVIGDQPLNLAAFTIHSAIHEARPDVVAAAHAHSTYGKAWSAMGRLLDPLTQDACVFYQDHAVFDDYTGVVREDNEGKRIADALGGGKAVILQNHGLLTVGQSVDAAAWWFITLENCCQVQLLVEAAGRFAPLDHERALATGRQIGRPRSGWHNFQPLWDMIAEEEPDLFE
jgi:ribulose-5-phosphate 4-epimerase/fuculose-1-phosphate aldolase